MQPDAATVVGDRKRTRRARGQGSRRPKSGARRPAAGNLREAENRFNQHLEYEGLSVGYLSEFICLIERLRERAEKHRDYLANNEAATRACLVDPVLRLLGWDVSDPEQVCVEYKVEGKSADYALMRDGKPLILIEAKSLGAKLKDDFWQLAVYAAKTGAVLGVMTNGDEWVFLDPNNVSQPQKARLHLSRREDHRTCALLFLEQLDTQASSKLPPPPQGHRTPPDSLISSKPPEQLQAIGLTQLERQLSELAPDLHAPKVRAVAVPSRADPLAVTSYAGLLCAVAETYFQQITERLPITQTNASHQYIAARSPLHGTGVRFRASRELTGTGGQESFYVNVHAKALRLVRWTIRLLTVIGVSPDEVTVELA